MSEVKNKEKCKVLNSAGVVATTATGIGMGVVGAVGVLLRKNTEG